MKRQYVIRQYEGSRLITAAAYTDPETALRQLRRSLEGTGRDQDTITLRMRTFTCVLMQGGVSYTVMDPDLKGSFSITIETTKE